MDISIAGFRLTFNFPDFRLIRRHEEKIHNFTHRVEGCHYFLSPAEDSNKIYMTADDNSVKCYDYILLTNDEVGPTQYQVEVIEHYSDSPSLWTALLVKC